MTTTINFNLSSILSGNLSGSSNGANVYAFAYDSGTLVQTASMLINGSTTGTTPSLTLNTIANGKIYVVVQEQGTGNGIADVASATGINAVGFFTPGNAQTYNFRYDLVELNLQGDPADVADISDINQFGLPITLTVNGQTRGFKVSGDTIAANIRSQSPSINGINLQDQTQFQFTPDTPLSGPRDTIVPGNNLAQNPFPGSDWTAYVNDFKNHVGEIELLTTFDGVPSKGLKGSLSDYKVQYDSTADVFWLHPNTETEHLAGMTTGWIRIPASELIDNIYLQTGHLEVYLAGPGSSGKMIKEYSSFTPNNAWGDISKVFVAGFDAGFWGSTGISPNTRAGANFDLDHTWNWDAAYAYAAALGQGNDYARDWGAGGAGQPGQGNRYYDPFGAEFFKNSNAYGYSYTDLISDGGGVSPAIPVANAQGVNVGTIDVTLWDRSETPTGWTSGNAGYVGGPYAAANYWSPANYFQFDLHFALNGLTHLPDNETPIVFKFYDPTATAGPGYALKDDFVWFTLPKGDWYGYTINQVGTTYSLTANGSSGLAGLFFITGVPVSQSGVSWYQLLVGDAHDYTTYNMYVTVDGSYVMNSAVIDHGVTTQAMTGGATGYKFVFADGGTMYYDIHTFLKPTAGPPAGALPQGPAPFAPPQPPPPPPPAAPLIGTLMDGIFVQIGDGSHLKQGDLAFSFTTSGNGNTLIPGHIAKIDLGNVQHSDWILSPITTMAGFDGDWTTKLSAQFGNGTFSAVLNQYAQSNFAFDNPTYSASTTLTFTVDLDKLALGAATGGQALVLSQGSSATKGNWIELSAVTSTLTNGTLVIYATDADGNMLARDGVTHATSLDDAALARLGSVASDDRSTVFFSGKQFVYLPVGEQLHFAIVTGNGQTDTNPHVNISGGANLFGVTVGDGFGTLNLTASVNNDLDKAAALAASQRLSDHPWLYLKQDAKLGVDLAWSGDYVNTLHFVRIDVNPTDNSKWQVGGVGYGNTDAFRAAVQANWEFSASQGHSTGTSSTEWTVKGGSGFYAPVLVNPDGDIWMVNQSPTSTANADGRQHIRDFGQGTFGFEDMHANKGADFDYNDMVMHLWLM